MAGIGVEWTRFGSALAVVATVTGCTPLPNDDDSGVAPIGEEDGSGVAAECPAVEDFQEVCDCGTVQVSWAALELGADVQLSELLTIFVEGDAESVAEAACERALDRGDIVDTNVYPLSGWADGSPSATLDLSGRDGLVGYSLLSGDQAHSLGFAYFVVTHESSNTSIGLGPWEE